ncbi:MAG TPA: hypothetical protein VJ023_03855 [Pyrinomonadaceae bacterium]|nr:hypothetical protein [Pyrinomonadaceae bacterium]
MTADLHLLAARFEQRYNFPTPSADLFSSGLRDDWRCAAIRLNLPLGYLKRRFTMHIPEFRICTVV